MIRLLGGEEEETIKGLAMSERGEAVKAILLTPRRKWDVWR